MVSFALNILYLLAILAGICLVIFGAISLTLPKTAGKIWDYFEKLDTDISGKKDDGK